MASTCSFRADSCRLLELSQNPDAASKLNADQKDTLTRKDQVLAPLKELQALAEQISAVDADRLAAQKSESAEREMVHEEAIRSAKQAGYESGKELVHSLVSFLGYASVLRINPTEDQEYNEAAERLLSIFYESGPDSIEAAEHLKQASQECIKGTAISYARIVETMRPAETGAEALESLQRDETEDAHASDTAAGHLVGLSEVAELPASTAAGGISFLNESEIEGNHAPEEDTLQEENILEAPAESVVETLDANSAAIAWNTQSPEINWADEVDSHELVQQPTTPAFVAPTDSQREAALPSRKAEDEFTQVEGRKRESGRGRGRGDRRGRGTRGTRGRPAQTAS
jgi:hypothetical protein